MVVTNLVEKTLQVKGEGHVSIASTNKGRSALSPHCTGAPPDGKIMTIKRAHTESIKV